MKDFDHILNWKLLGGSHVSLAPTVARASTRQQSLRRVSRTSHLKARWT
jgi:hypothetical protein